MANDIQHRRNSTLGVQPSTLLPAELAVNTNSGNLKAWLGQSDGTPIRLAMFSDIASGSGAFQRKLSGDFTLQDGESVVISEYIDPQTYSLTLNGDAALEIL